MLSDRSFSWCLLLQITSTKFESFIKMSNEKLLFIDRTVQTFNKGLGKMKSDTSQGKRFLFSIVHATRICPAEMLVRKIGINI